ncbi:hypothetical protein J7M28_10985 [bacterium]|nr:hypothetical protein [bacterium]
MREKKLLVLFVCSGNICRSPLGAAMLKSELDTLGIDGVIVESAGTFYLDGRCASELAIEVAFEHGLDLTHHRSRQINEDMLLEADIVVAATPAHADHMATLCPETRKKAIVLDVPDPYGMHRESYNVAFSQLSDAMPMIIEEIRRKLGNEE